MTLQDLEIQSGCVGEYFNLKTGFSKGEKGVEKVDFGTLLMRQALLFSPACHGPVNSVLSVDS